MEQLQPATPLKPDYATPHAALARAAMPPRERLWPAQGLGRHLIVVTALLCVVIGAYWNSYDSGMTLDNKYIIEEYYKAVMRINPKLDLEGREQVAQLFKYDYWWPKGISGLYRPITSFTYWVDYVFLTGKAPKFDWKGNPIKNAKGEVITKADWQKMTWAEYTAAPGNLNCNSYHTINLALHWINAVLIYFVSLVLLQRLWPAAFVAALFAAHPIATETVTNIIGRADIFAALTVFGGLLVYMRSCTSRQYLWRLPWLIGLMLICAFGFFSKESAIAIGAVIPLYWLTFRFGWDKLAIWKLLLPAAAIVQLSFTFFPEMTAAMVAGGAILVLFVWWVIFAVKWDAPESWPLFSRLLIEVFCVWTFMLPPLIAMIGVRDWVFRNSSPAETPFLDNPIRGIWQVKELNIPSFEKELANKPMRGLNRLECKMTAIKIEGRLLMLLTWPWTLSSDYSYAEIPNFSFHLNTWDDWQAIIALVVLLAVVGIAIWLWRRGNKAAVFFIGFFFLAGLPTSNFIVTIGSVMAERFMYLPLAGFTGVVVILVFTLAQKLWKWLKLEDPDDFPWHRVLAGSFLAMVVVIYSIRAFYRNRVWHDDESLWRDAIVHSTRSFRCYQSLAFALYEKDAYGNVDEMIRIAEGALPIVDPLPNHLNSSRLYLHLGMYYSLKAETLSRHMPDGSIVGTPESNAYYQKAVNILERGSQVDRAFNEVNKAKQRLRHDPAEEITDAGLGPVYGTLGLAYARLGDYDNARKRLEYQRQLDPTDIDAYLKLATVEIAAQHVDKAAAILIECMLMDSTRPQIWGALVQVFNAYGERGQGALVVDNGQLRLNINHELVRFTLLEAYRDFIRTFRQSHRFVMAEEARKTALEQYHFPAAIIDELFNEPVLVVTPDGVQYGIEDPSVRGFRPKLPTTLPSATGPVK